MNVLIVGDRPGPNTDPKDPLFIHTTTGAAARLAKMMALDSDAYHAIRRINARHDGEKLLELDEARTRLRKILMDLEGPWLTILVGAEAARVYGGALIAGNPVSSGDLRALYIPHTSGMNRFWNVAENVQFYEMLLKAELAKITG